MIYEPQEDSLLLVSCLPSSLQGRILDVGCGSGVLSIEARSRGGDVLSLDIDPAVVKHAKILGLNVLQSDLFENVSGKFDWILFNPPYLPLDEAEDEESRRVTTGGKHGHELLERFLKDAKKFLKKDGKILLVVSSLTGNVDVLFKKYRFNVKKLKEESHFFERLIVYELTSIMQEHLLLQVEPTD